jgi:hypothetical protein
LTLNNRLKLFSFSLSYFIYSTAFGSLISI